MIILPTRNRTDNVKRFIRAYRDTKATLPVYLVVDMGNKSHYEEVWRSGDVPLNWQLHINKFPRDLRAAMNGIFEQYPDKPYYAVLADDVVPETEGWDVKLRDACLPRGVAWGDDDIHQDRFAATHPFIGGDLVRAWGWLCPPFLKRGSVDLLWRQFAIELGLARYCADVKLEHRHWQVGKAAFDTTYAAQPSHTVDGAAYQAYIHGPEFQEDLKRVKGVLGL